MGSKLTITGGPQLRARLDAVAKADYTREWAEDAAALMRHTKPASKRPASNVFTTKVTETRAAIFGAFWWIFVDRGTKAHDIFGAGAKNPPETLRFSVGGRTIFAKKVRHPRTSRRPFITRAARDALAGNAMAQLIIKSWNSRRLKTRSRFI